MSKTTLFGPPGTGKTTTLSRWAKSAAEKHGGENILICSLTRTAAAEIASRDTGVPKENVGTLHAHAYRSLEDAKVMGKEEISEWNETYPHWKIDQSTAFDDDVAGATPGGETALSRYDLLRATCTPFESMPTGIQDFATTYEEFKSLKGVIDFTDMIQIAINTVDCPVDYIIMDEAQDCSALEFKLLQKWSDQCKGAVIAGDDDQAAYEWRGASVDAFLGFSDDHRILDQSYRVPESVQRRADLWIHRVSKRKEKNYAPKQGEPGKCVALDFRRPSEVIRHALLQSGSTMILCTCGYMTLPFVGELKKLAEPFWNPYRLRGDYASTWNPLAQGGKKVSTVTDSVVAFLSPPWTWSTGRAWLRELQGLPRGSKKLLDENRRSEDLMPLETLNSMLGDSGLMAALDGDMDWFLANCKADKKRRSALQFRMRIAKRFGVEGLTQDPAIVIGTIHSVKGGEAENVYLVPDLSSKGKESWGFRGQKDPIIRQIYIGMTRASRNLFLVKPPKGSPLNWG